MVEPIPAGWQTKKLWEVTNWDKRFNSVSKEKQKRILSFKHILAEEMKSILVKGGTIKLLATGKFDGYTTQELAKDNINIGEVMTLPSGGTASIKYYDGEFVDSGNLIAQSSDLNEYYLKYIYYYLLFINATVADKYKGTSIKHPYMPEILELIIPFPSISEQKRIVKKLDDAIYKIDCMKANAEFTLAATKDLFESYVECLFAQTDANWIKKPLKDITKLNQNKSEIRNLPQDTLVSFVPMEFLGINQKYFTSDKTGTINDLVKNYTYFAENDIIIAKITPCFENGKIGIAKNLINNIGFGSSEYIVLRPIPEVNNQYLYYFLNRHSFRKQGASKMKGAVGHKRVEKSFIENYSISYPSLEEQVKIVEKLDNLHDRIKKLEQIYTQKIKLLDDLKQSILKKAFAGEL